MSNEEPKITTWKEWTIWIWEKLKQQKELNDKNEKRFQNIESDIKDLTEAKLISDTTKKVSWNTITTIALIVFNIILLIITYLTGK